MAAVEVGPRRRSLLQLTGMCARPSVEGEIGGSRRAAARSQSMAMKRLVGPAGVHLVLVSVDVGALRRIRSHFGKIWSPKAATAPGGFPQHFLVGPRLPANALDESARRIGGNERRSDQAAMNFTRSSWRRSLPTVWATTCCYRCCRSVSLRDVPALDRALFLTRRFTSHARKSFE